MGVLRGRLRKIKEREVGRDGGREEKKGERRERGREGWREGGEEGREEREKGGRGKRGREEGHVIISMHITAMKESLSLGVGVVVSVGGVCSCDGIEPRVEEPSHLEHTYPHLQGH